MRFYQNKTNATITKVQFKLKEVKSTSKIVGREAYNYKVIRGAQGQGAGQHAGDDGWDHRGNRDRIEGTTTQWINQHENREKRVSFWDY